MFQYNDSCNYLIFEPEFESWNLYFDILGFFGVNCKSTWTFLSLKLHVLNQYIKSVLLHNNFNIWMIKKEVHLLKCFIFSYLFK